MSLDNSPFAQVYSESSFWEKLAGFAKKAGYDVIEKALQLYYVLKEKDTPIWAKTTIIGALGYFISPIDAIPDVTPAVGFADDVGVLAAAIAAVAAYISDAIKAQVEAKLKEWFGA